MWTAERWREIERLFAATLEIAADQRKTFLEQACGGDATLRAQVERMLVADEAEHAMVDSAALPEPPADRYSGTVLGAWRIEDKIGDGGAGAVYRAFRVDGAFSRPVALKILHAGFVSAALRERFLREPRFLGRLEHPNIARLLDGGTTGDGMPYVVMELVAGEPIDRFCDSRRLTLEERVGVFRIVCDAVDHAHRFLVVHRDLKPANVLVTTDGQPRLVDFGIASLVESDESGGAYTPEYASPEQVRGAVAGIASDVWSLGVLLHQLATGKRPYSSREIRAFADDPSVGLKPVLASAAFDPSDAANGERAAARRTTAHRLARRLRGDFDAIVSRAVAPDSAARYSSCRDLAADLERWLADREVSARPRGALESSLAFVRRHAIACSLAAALVLSMIVGTIVSVWWASVAESRRESAEAQRHAAEAQAAHAGIEAHSGSLVAHALTDIFLSEQNFASTPSLERARGRLQDEASALRRQYRDDRHLLANVLDGLGRGAQRVGLLDDAEALIREGLALRTAEFGDDHLERALSLGSLGQFLYRRGEIGQCREILEEAVAIHRAHLGSVHSDLALALNDLAAACTAAGDYERGIALHGEALALRRSRDPSSPLVAESLNNLGSAYVRLGRVDDAIPLLDESIEIRRAQLGPRSWLTLQAIANRGVLELRRGNPEGARDRLLEAIEGFRELRAAGLEGLANALPKLAYAALQTKDVAGAEAAIAEAESIVREIDGPLHPRLADVIEQRALIARAKLDRAGAAAAFEAVLNIRRAALPADHPSLAMTLHNVGVARSDAGNHEGALALLDESLRLRDDDAALDAETRGALGVVLARLDRHAEAEVLLREAVGAVAPQNSKWLGFREQLAKTLRALGREEEAKELDG
jgi:eukaryotic-like serine/threonine-protein kinase